MDVIFSEPTAHMNKVFEHLVGFWRKRELCDVTLFCGGLEFPCHRVVLASFSSYFEAMFTSGMAESRQETVELKEMEPEAIGMLVKYAYTLEVVISVRNVQALLVAANMLVREACCRFLECNMDERSCVGIHCFAEAHSCTTLERHCMDYILENFSDVYQQDEFLSLSLEKLTGILSNDYLVVPKEEMVFEAAMLWLNKCPTRKDSFEKVFEQIRLRLINPSYLQEVIDTLDVVKESQGCQRLISEAKDDCHRAQPRRSPVILTVGGLDDDRNFLDTVESFDPQTNEWNTLAQLSIAVIDHSLVVSGSNVYLAGGKLPDASVSREMWRYDPSHGSWLKMAPMNEARRCFDLVTLGGYVFAVGGMGKNGTLDSVERYDIITNTWKLMESVGMPLFNHLPRLFPVVVLDGLIYAIGTDQIFSYNPETSVWRNVAPMLGVGRYYSAACTLNGKIYIIGGHLIGGQVECYDPKTNQSTMCAPMIKKNSITAVVVMCGKIYVLGGLKEFRYDRTIEQYDDEKNTWEIVEEMPTGRGWFRCVSLRLRKDTHAQLQVNDGTCQQTGGHC